MKPMWMLDTNVVSDAIRNSRGPVATRLLKVSSGVCCMSIITLAELRFGAAKVNSRRLNQQIDGFAALAPALPFEHPAETVYALSSRREASSSARTISSSQRMRFRSI
jgi:tRNA(fMet)-specific endonuclease VapC